MFQPAHSPGNAFVSGTTEVVVHAQPVIPTANLGSGAGLHGVPRVHPM
jgi:hypothetical protein